MQESYSVQHLVVDT